MNLIEELTTVRFRLAKLLVVPNTARVIRVWVVSLYYTNKTTPEIPLNPVRMKHCIDRSGQHHHNIDERVCRICIITTGQCDDTIVAATMAPRQLGCFQLNATEKIGLAGQQTCIFWWNILYIVGVPGIFLDIQCIEHIIICYPWFYI